MFRVKEAPSTRRPSRAKGPPQKPLYNNDLDRHLFAVAGGLSLAGLLGWLLFRWRRSEPEGNWWR